MRPCDTRDQPLELAANHLRDIQQRPQRTGRPQRLTASPEDDRRVAERLTESTQQRRLTHTRLAPYQHQPPFRRRPDPGKQIAENRHTLRALNQFAHPPNAATLTSTSTRSSKRPGPPARPMLARSLARAALWSKDWPDLTARDWPRPEEGS